MIKDSSALHGCLFSMLHNKKNSLFHFQEQLTFTIILVKKLSTLSSKL